MPRHPLALPILLAALVLASLAPWGCGRGPQGRPPDLTDLLPRGERRPLEVVFAAPRGPQSRLGKNPQILVSFNQPMSLLGALPTEEPVPTLRIQPPLAGKERWKGTATLAFIPDGPLPPGTRFKVTLPAGVRSLSGEALARDYTFEFATPGPALVASEPANEDRWVRPDASVMLVFDQPMDPARAQAYVTLSEDCAGQIQQVPVALRHLTPDEWQARQKEPFPSPEGGGGPSWEEDFVPTREQVLLAVPQRPLKVGCRYTLKLLKDLPAATGTLGMTGERTLTFSTYQAFALERVRTDDGDPEGALELTFSNPVSPRALARALSFSPPLQIPEGSLDDEEPRQEFYLYLPLRPRTEYTLSLAPDLQDQFGNRLGTSVRKSFETGDYRPEFYMVGGSGVLEADGPLSIPAGVRNLPAVRLRMARVAERDLVGLLAGEDPFWSEDVAPPRGWQVDEVWKLDPPANQRVDRPLDLRRVLDGRFGVVFLEVQPLDAKWRRRALVQVTRMGLSAKFSPENTLIWVTELASARPLAGVDLEVRDRDNKILWRGRSDADGLAQAPGWAVLGLRPPSEWDDPTQFVLARRGADLAYVTSDTYMGVSPWEFDLDYDYAPRARRFASYAFTERGLYRAGDKVHLKGLLRESRGGRWILPEIEQLSYKITDSRDQVVEKGQVAVSDWGSFSHDLQLGSQAPTGFYQVSYWLPPGVQARLKYREPVASVSFRVEAYRPAQFEVSVRPSASSYVCGDQAQATLTGRYLFGAPMAGDRVSWLARLEPLDYRPPGYEGYDFGPDFPEEGRDEPRVLLKEKGQLDPQGQKKITLPLTGIDYRGSALLVIEGTVTSVARQQVSGRAEVPLHRGSFYLGLRPQSTFVEAGKPVGVDLVAVSPEGKAIAGQAVTVELVSREWDSVRKQGEPGRFYWVVEPKDTSLGTRQATSAAGPVRLQLTPPKAGFYLIRAEGKDSRGNTVRAVSYFYASGRQYVPWARYDNDRVDLVRDKASYAPGETARILVKSPYEKCTALVTVERELIMRRWVVPLSGSAPTIEVPIDHDDLPNAYVSVVLLSGRIPDAGQDEGEDKGRPTFKLGYVNLPVTPQEKRLTVQVSSSKASYRPGDECTVGVSVKDAAGRPVPAEVALAVVDQGVLALIDYKTPDPFEAFYGPRPLAVTSAVTLVDLIGQRSYGEKGASQGGGGAESERLRQDFVTTAYWNPSLRTDARGQARATFKLPDNLTTFRVMATAQTPSSLFGAGESRFTVNKPLLLQPSVPRFARLGDEVQGGVMVFNNTDQPGTVTLEAGAEGVQLQGPATSSVSLQPGQAREVLFRYRAGQAARATLTYRARMGPHTDGLKLDLPVEPPRATEAVATSGDTTEARVSQEVQAPGNREPGVGSLQVSLASSALVGLQASLQDLVSYPYGCLEQRLSRVLPMIESQELVSAFGLAVDAGQARRLVRQELEEMRSFQRPSGGFGLWPDSDRVNDYVTAYALYTLHAARQKGYEVDERLARRAVKYLENALGAEALDYPYSLNERLTTKAYMLYALALWQSYRPSILNLLADHADQMSLEGLSYLLRAARLYPRDQVPAFLAIQLQERLLRGLGVEGQSAHWEEPGLGEMGWIFGSNVRTTALCLQAMLEGEEEFSLAPRVVAWLMEARDRSGDWGSTQANIACVQALTAYYRRYEGQPPDFTATVQVAGQTVLEQSFKGRGLAVAGRELPASGLPSAGSFPVIFSKDGPGRLYYGLRLTYAPAGEVPPRDEGMAVFKTVAPLGGQGPVADYAAGSTYMVTLSVIVPQERRFVVLDDPLPGGFEVVQTTFATESDEMREILAQAREDRPWWGTFNHWEIEDQRVLLFADGLAPGEHTFQYLVRASYPGTYLMPATRVEEMYHPEIFGTTARRTVVIRGGPGG